MFKINKGTLGKASLISIFLFFLLFIMILLNSSLASPFVYSFNNFFLCDDCNNLNVPSDTEMNFVVNIDVIHFKDESSNIKLINVIPSDWEIIDTDNGKVIDAGYYRNIEWDVDLTKNDKKYESDLYDIVTIKKICSVKSPLIDETKDYNFISMINGENKLTKVNVYLTNYIKTNESIQNDQLNESSNLQEDLAELKSEQIEWKNKMERNGITISITKTLENKYKTRIEKNNLAVEFEDLEESDVDWNKTVEMNHNVNQEAINEFLSKDDLKLKDFVWIDSNGFINDNDYNVKIILPSIYKNVFYCEGVKENPECSIIKECGEKPCYEEKDSKTILYLNHFSGGGGADPTNQYNQDNSPYIVNGTIVGGVASNLNTLGEGLTYDVVEVQNETQETKIWNKTPTTSDRASTDLAYGSCTAGELETDNNDYCGDTLSIDRLNEWGYVNSTHSSNIPPDATITNVTVCWSGYFETGTNNNANDISYVRVGENSSGSWAYTNVASCIGTTCNFNADTTRCYDVTGIFTDAIKASHVRLSLYHIEADTNNMDIFDDYNYVNITYTQPLYRIEVWHNSTQISFTGDLVSINATLNFTTNVSDTYSLQIYDWKNSQWISTSCDSGSVVANTATKWWCNMTSNPMNYNSSDGRIRIRINSTADLDAGLLKEDYVQYYVGFMNYLPKWQDNSTSVLNNSQYSPGRNYGFQINWVDPDQGDSVSKVLFEWNGYNYTQYASPAVQNIGNTYWINFTDLPAGNYNYKWFANDSYNSWNYTEPTLTYSVQKNQSNPIKLYFRNSTGEYLNQNMTVNYEELINATEIIVYPNSGTISLYRNEVDVTSENGQNVLLGYNESGYAYKANTSGNANYSANSTGETHYIIINKKSTTTYLLVNGSRQNLGVALNNYINFTVELVGYPSRNVELWTNYSDGTWKLWDSGNSPLENVSQMGVTGKFRFIGNYSGNENYTYSEDASTITVSSVSLVSKIESFSPTSINQSQNSTVVGNCSCESGTCDNVYIEIQSDFQAILNTSGNDLQVNGSSSYSLGYLSNDWAVKSWNITGWKPGMYSIRIKCNSTQTGDSFSEIQNLEINDIENPTWSNNVTSVNSGTMYEPSKPYQFNVTWSDNKDISMVLIEHNFTGGSVPHNDTLSNESSIYYFNVNGLAAGTYVWKEYANDAEDNWNGTNNGDYWFYVVNKSSVQLILENNESWSAVYPEATNTNGSGCPAQLTDCYLYRNDSGQVSNPNEVILGVGVYKYTYNTSGNQNYSSNSTSDVLTISKGNVQPVLSINTSWTEVYPEATKVECSVTSLNNEVSCNLYRNDTGLINSDEVILGVGVYKYTTNTSETYNYSANYTGESQILTIEKNTSSSISLFLNDSQNNFEINSNQAVNTTAVLSIPSSNVIEIWTNYSDGVWKLWDSCSACSSLENVTILTEEGIWNFTANFTNENYSSAYESFYVNFTMPAYGWLNVNLTEPDPSVYDETSPLDVNQYSNFTVKANVTCEYGETCGEVNGTVRYNITMNGQMTIFNETFPNADAQWIGDDDSDTAQDKWWNVTQEVGDESSISISNDLTSGGGNFGSPPSSPYFVRWEECDPSGFTGCYVEARNSNGVKWNPKDSGWNSGYINFSWAYFVDLGEGIRFSIWNGTNWIDVWENVSASNNLFINWIIFSWNMPSWVFNLTEFSFRVTAYADGVGDVVLMDNVIMNINVSMQMKPISTTTGAIPFYTTNSQPQTCGVLNYGETCELSWTVNATGTIGSEWKIGVLFSSNESIPVNHTDNATVRITTPPQIEFIPPTPVNGTIQKQTWFEVNASIIETNLDELKYDWNGTNYTYYNDSLVLMFNFDNVSALGENDTYVVDLSGNGNNGTVIGDGGVVLTSDCKFGNCFTFDGVSDGTKQIEDDVKIINDYPFTISAWFKANPKDVADPDGVIVDFADKDGSTIRFGLYLDSDDYGIHGALVLRMSNGTDDDVTSASEYDDQKWHHVVGVYSSNTSRTLYIDGEFENSSSVNMSYPAEVDRWDIGRWGDSTPKSYFNGTIDEVRIWNRSLSADEIYQQYISNLNKYDTDKWILYVNQSLNASDGLPNGTYTYQAFASDTTPNMNQTEERIITISNFYLEVELVLPPGNTFIERYKNFTVNATVYCRNGNCGNIYGTVRYNLTSSNPDTPVNITYGDEPFFVNETLAYALKTCSNDMQQDEFCNVTWSINVTGNSNSEWKIGILFNSSYPGLTANNTDNITIIIVSCIEEISLRFSNVGFGSLFPSSTGNQALENPNDKYNITNSGSCLSDIWIKATNLVNGTNEILYNNISFNNVSNDYGNSYRIDDEFSSQNSSLKRNVPGKTNVTSYYFLDVPAIYAGNYSGNITFCLNSSAYPSLCE